MAKKTKDKFFKYYEQLPPIAKTALSLAAIAAIGLVGYGIYKAFKKDEQGQEGDAAESELDELKKEAINPTYPDAQYESWAQAIVSAIDGLGTDEAAIYAIFRQLNNLADVYKLIAVYGVRTYKGAFEGWFDKITDSLSGALSKELSDSEKGKLNSILQEKGIQFVVS